METICPNCGKHDNIYLRSGGALVCRACFVTEAYLGSWLDLGGPAVDDLPDGMVDAAYSVLMGNGIHELPVDESDVRRALVAAARWVADQSLLPDGLRTRGEEAPGE